MEGFSIILCCYNSAQLLPATLERLAALVLPPDAGTELILVDNCCTDDTAAVARKAWEALQTPYILKIVAECTPGLSWARKKGIETARYDYLLFCDDDNLLAPDYLEAALVILRDHPDTGMLGGLGKPVYTRRPSYWPADFYVYGSGPQADDNGITWTLYGAAIILRKSAFAVLDEAGFHFMLSDRKGSRLTSGGDYELCYAIAMAGFEIRYHDTLKFSHFIAEERLTRAYCRRFIRESAPALTILDVYHFAVEHPDPRWSLFYLKQIKNLFHHGRMILHCALLKYRYRHDEQMNFLKDFHGRYHFARLCSLSRDIFHCGRYIRRVSGLKTRLKQGCAGKQACSGSAVAERWKAV
jgi:glycosyltransferase involved in cell wall biosynthesis